MKLADWESKGRYYHIRGHKVFTVEEGKHDQTLVILHGYPSASYDYFHVLPILTQHFRVIVHDQLGFGLSDKSLTYSYSLIEQAEIALELWQEIGVQEAHLLAHDYGTSVATEIIARRDMGQEPVKLLSATLGNGSMLIDMAQLLFVQKALRSKYWGPKVAKLVSRPMFMNSMRKIWADRSKINMQELEVLWELLQFNNGKAVTHQITQYLWERKTFWHRWIGGLYKTDLPINIYWAEEDPVAVVGMAHELHKNISQSKLELLPGVGHYPMLEAPELWSEAVCKMILSQE